jgi:hypothetical protein
MSGRAVPLNPARHPPDTQRAALLSRRTALGTSDNVAAGYFMRLATVSQSTRLSRKAFT